MLQEGLQGPRESGYSQSSVLTHIHGQGVHVAEYERELPYLGTVEGK